GDADYQAPGEIEGRGNPTEWQRVPALVKHTHWIMRCVNCGRDTYFLTKGEPKPTTPIEAADDAMLRCPCTIAHQYPIWVATAHDAVPVAIAGATDEAERCLAAGAPNACAVMTRRAIHSLCEDKGASGRDLFAQLKDLKEKQVITPDLHEWADSLRVLGRDGAHPEFPEVTDADAEDGVNLLREIIKFVYILPHERAQRRNKKS
ncbi:MAG TPA: DUF4145 domain-containing protein, partial [Bryobacteraceae bacterium]|nr:DUF4145 domain-containing protein [Bryobacteraceae bacterium]